ncbi:hypothetical protein [Amnibacterium sp.]|uniref:hypothetical protein n=1 Tax=Amnibacterium sp. TaxID=1872496 RepID=UPI003F7B7F12
MSEQRTTEVDAGAAEMESMPVETARIIRTGTVWTAAAMLAPALGLGPLLAGGWRPGAMPIVFAAAWWLGALVAAAGLALLVWAGCPVLGFRLAQAYRQKVVSIRVGIVLNLSGMTLAGLAILLAPVSH